MPGRVHNDRAGISPLPCLALALLSAAIVVAGVMLVAHPVFYINDDMALQAILAGSISGSPDPHAVYMNVLVCLPITWLFQVCPGLPWFLYALEAGMFAACASVGFAIIRVFGSVLPSSWHSAFRLAASFAAACIAELCLFWANGATPDYTILAAILSGASVLLCVMALECEAVGDREKRIMVGCSTLLVLGAYCVRGQSGLVGLAFMGIVCAFRAFGALRADGLGRWQRAASAAFVPFGVACALVAIAYGAQAIAYSSPEWREYGEFNRARTAYFDYGHVSYDEHPERYDAAGWNESLRDLVNTWFLMDERVTAEALDSLSLDRDAAAWRNPLKMLVLDKYAFDNPTLATHFGVVLCLCAWCLSFGGRTRWRWQPIVLLVASFALITYLVVSGRFLYRGAVCATFPAMLGALAYGLSVLHALRGGGRVGGEALPFSGKSRMRFAFPLVAVAFIEIALMALLLRGGLSGHKNVVSLAASIVASALIVYAFVAKRLPARAGQAWFALLCVCILVGIAPWQSTVKHLRGVDAEVAKYEAVYQYVEEHPDDVFVHGPGLSSLKPDLMSPVNFIAWGGWTYASPLKLESYGRAGYSGGMYAKDFLDERVYVISGNPQTIELLTSYYASNCEKPVTNKVVASLGYNTYVYKFS